MTRDEFDQFIRQLEKKSQKHPRRFLFHTVGLVGLAYAYLSLVLLVSLALCLGIIFLIVRVPNFATVKLGLVGLALFGGLFWVILRGLWVRMDAPKGYAIRCNDAPELFRLLDELSAQLNCAPFHTVLLVPEYNAAVVQVPRLGVFGWHRNYLLLGLPLMQSLTPDEFKAVLAHEFAHSSRGHGRLGNWLYRVRQSWDQIFTQIEKQQTRCGFVLATFIRWFWPVFNGHAFVLARDNEYEADACAARHAGAATAANALMRLPVNGGLLEEKFWPDIIAHANSDEEPPANVLLLQAEALKTGPAPADASRWLKQAFLAETNSNDTHPCLKDRLGAMNQLPADFSHPLPAPPMPPPQTAAEVLLGSCAQEASHALSKEWQELIREDWKERHKRAIQLGEELKSPDTPATTPSVETLWKRAAALVELHDDNSASPLVEQILTMDNRHAGANFVKGRLLLAKDDPAGIAFIDTAMQSDDLLTLDGCELLFGYYTRTGQRDMLRPLEERADRFQQRFAQGQFERTNISIQDRFLPHELDPQQLSALREIMQAETDVKRAAIAKKRVAWHPQQPCYVIAVRIKTSIWKFRSSSANQKLVDRVIARVELPGNLLVFVDEQNLKPLARKIYAIADAIFYRRKD